MIKPLTLHLRGEYFDAVKSGTKSEEYRLASKWSKRIEGRTFSHIVLFRGYPSYGDKSRTLLRAWCGYRRTTITHPHFGDKPVEVIAINVAQVRTKKIACPDCYGGHFRPCNICGDSGVVDLIVDQPQEVAS